MSKPLYGRFLPAVLSLSMISAPAGASVIISEIMYDATGADAGKVFVELYGTPGTDLSGYRLLGINGGDGSIYKTIDLSGIVPPDGIFVVADDAGGGTTSVPNADLILSVDFQNGPDSVQLLAGGMLLDAVGYGDFTGAVFAGEGTPAPDVAGGHSLARLIGPQDTDDNAADFIDLDVPTPGSLPGSTVSPVPLPGALWLFASGLGLLTVARRRS